MEDWQKLESLKHYMGACVVESDQHLRGSTTVVSCGQFLLTDKIEIKA